MSEAERCELEIQDIRLMGDDVPAYLTVLGWNDWSMEKEMIENE